MVYFPHRIGYAVAVAVFTELTSVMATELAAAYALGPIVHVESLEAGTVNSNYRISGPGTTWFVRINEGKSREDVAWECELLQRLGVETSVNPLRSTAGQPYWELPGTGKFVTLFPWLEGRHVATADTLQLEALAHWLAQFHQRGVRLGAEWHRTSQYGPSGLRTRLAAIVASDDPLARAAGLRLEPMFAEVSHALTMVMRPFGIIHGDLFRDNVLWTSEGTPCVLDFEQASGGSLAYDLAVVLLDWCWVGGVHWAAVQTVLCAYDRITPIRDWLPTLGLELRFASMRFVITRLTDVYLAGISKPDKDFRDFLARLDAWSMPESNERLMELAKMLRAE